jgi:hypothetical protein
VRITHVQPVTALATVPVAAAEPLDTLDLECRYQGLRHALWTALYFSHSVKLPDVEYQLTWLLRDVDRLRAELGVA